jgi:hypothetical protein
MKTNKTLFTLVTGLFLVLMMAACGKETPDPNSNLTMEKPSYHLEITGADGAGVNAFGIKIIEGVNIESNWDSDLGYAWLGTDASNLPIATITIVSEGSNPENDDEMLATVNISTTDARTGTSEELNPKLYIRESIRITDIEIGNNYISGVFGGSFTEVNTNETFSIFCQFVALDFYSLEDK